MNFTPPRRGGPPSSSTTPIGTTPVSDSGDGAGMQSEISSLLEQLEDARRRLRQETTRGVQRRSAEVMETELKKCQGIVSNVDHLFREWTVYLAGEPLQRQKTRFLYEKLHGAFGQQKRDLSRLRVQVQDSIAEVRRAQNSMNGSPPQRAFHAPVELDETPMPSTPDLEMGEPGEDMLGQQASQQMESAGLLQNRIARERDQGIQNMQTGIHEIQGIFKDIATMVTEQGQTIQTIENNAMDSLENTQKGRSELEKAHRKAAANRQNAFIVLVIACILLWMLWWMGSKPSNAIIDASTPPPANSANAFHAATPQESNSHDGNTFDSSSFS